MSALLKTIDAYSLES